MERDKAFHPDPGILGGMSVFRGTRVPVRNLLDYLAVGRPLRLSALFGTTPEFWLNGQRNWDLWHAMRSPKAREIQTIRRVARA